MPPIPWEDRLELGILRAFGRTLFLAARHPAMLYARCRRPESPLGGIVFGLVVALFVAALELGHDTLAGHAEVLATIDRYRPELEKVLPGAADGIASVLRGSALVSFLLTPLSYLFELVSTTAVTWIGLRLVRKLRTPFAVLLRAFAYASWVRVFGALGASGDLVLGALGSLLSFGLGSYAWLVVVKETQDIDTTSAVYASLAGGAVAIALAGVLGVPVLIAAALWAATHVQLPAIGQ